MQTCETLLLQNYSTKFLDITHKYSLGMCNNVSSNSGTTYIIDEIIAKENLSIANWMQSFENIFLKNCSSGFLDIAHKQSLIMCN